MNWKIPISISPFFWATAALIGYLNSGSLYGVGIWTGIIFVSVLFHELGHAITAVLFRQKTRIQLVAFGGLTSYEGPKLKFWQQFIIVFNGPLFGFLLFVLATILLQFQWSPLWMTVFKMSQFANLFWSILNLFPVLPLDGGQLLRIALEAVFGVKGYKASLMVGAILSVIVALGFFAIGAFLIGAIFFLFAFQSFDLWRKAKTTTIQDLDGEVVRKLASGEEALIQGNQEEALRIFNEVAVTTKSGDTHNRALQYLAVLKWQRGQKEEAYQILLPIEDQLSDDVRCVLHALASEHQNWPLVAKLSTECFQFAPTVLMALNNARAFAFLKESKPAGGWLQTAAIEGSIDLENVLKEAEFQAIKDEPDFQHFIRNLQ